MKRKIIFLFLIFFFVGTIKSQARLFLPEIIGDNMVIQQQTDVRIWGKANPDAEVFVWTEWNRRKNKCVADADGKWQVYVKTPKAGGPYIIKIFSGKDKEILKDVLVGEVWLCSGQSNMAMPMYGFANQPIEGNTDLILKAKPSTQIRICNVVAPLEKEPLEFPVSAHWQQHTPDAVGSASATAYFFARYLNEVLQVPVGIITAAVGGTRVEQWMDQETLAEYDYLFESRRTVKREQEIQKTHSQHYNGKIAPIEKFSIRGEIWFQGENNVSNPEVYEVLFPKYVEMMRKNWGVGNFPFYYVQIGSHDYKEPDGTCASVIREIQRKALDKIPESGMAIVIDDQYCTIHNANKKLVGERLAYLALEKTYSFHQIESQGPLYDSLEIKGSVAHVIFKPGKYGIAPYRCDVKGFEIAGEDRIFYPAKARTVANKMEVIVSSPKVKHPVAVRYAFRNVPETGLYNNFGIPASPFRTDNWDL